jgi:hypothetical protein
MEVAAAVAVVAQKYSSRRWGNNVIRLKLSYLIWVEIDGILGPLAIETEVEATGHRLAGKRQRIIEYF